MVRSLGAAGYRCVVVSASGRSIAGASRYASREYAAADPLDAPEAFADAIVALVSAEQASLLLPIAEPAMLAMLPARARVGDCVIPFPDLESFRALSDKQRLLEVAATLGIAVPAQVVAESAEAAGALAATFTYPLVLKPARSVGELDGARHRVSVVYAATPADLRRQVATLSPAAFPLLLQQRIIGPGTGVFLLLWNGTMRACFAHRRRTEKPPSGGVSVYCESIAMDDELLARSRALLDRFGWRGVAMVEYKRDADTGRPYLMEVNGRFWGSLQLAIDAGVDFPRLLADAALGGAAVPAPTYRVGVRSRWWWGNVDHVITRLRRPAVNRALPPGTASIARVLTDLVLAPWRAEDHEEVMRWSDPRPFLRESVQWFRRR